MNTTTINRGVWSEDEHDRFLQAIQVYPHGPWRYVAKHVGTRDVRQVQTHAQKYYEKIDRHMRGLRKERRSWVRSEHRIDELPPGLQRPMGGSFSATSSPSSITTSNIPARLHAASPGLLHRTASVPISSNEDMMQSDHMCLHHPHAAHSAPEYSAMMELPTLEESLDMLLEYLSD